MLLMFIQGLKNSKVQNKINKKQSKIKSKDHQKGKNRQ